MAWRLAKEEQCLNSQNETNITSNFVKNNIPLQSSGHYMYRTLVAVCTAQWSLYVPHSGHCMYRTVVTICTAQWSLYVPHSWRIAPLLAQHGTLWYIDKIPHSTELSSETVHIHMSRLYCCLSLLFIFLYRFVFLCFLSLSLSLCRLVRTISKSVCYSRHVRPSVRMYHLGCHWTDTPEIWYRVLLCKSVEKIHIWLQSDKNYRNALRLEYIYFCRRRTRSSREMLSGC